MTTHPEDVSVFVRVPAAGDVRPSSGPRPRAAVAGEPDATAIVGSKSGEDAAHIAAGVHVRVPNVLMQSEPQARARIEAAGLEAGRRIPAPRPVSHRPEVVVRTFPSAGTLVQAGSPVDYELLPGEALAPAELGGRFGSASAEARA